MDGTLTNEAFLERFRISIDDMFGKPLENTNGRTKRLSYPDKVQQASRCGQWGQSSAEDCVIAWHGQWTVEVVLKVRKAVSKEEAPDWVMWKTIAQTTYWFPTSRRLGATLGLGPFVPPVSFPSSGRSSTGVAKKLGNARIGGMPVGIFVEIFKRATRLNLRKAGWNATVVMRCRRWSWNGWRWRWRWWRWYWICLNFKPVSSIRSSQWVEMNGWRG